MAIKVKAATYGPVIAQFDEQGVLQFGKQGELSVTPPLDSPAVTLLYSIASCMVLSLQMVMKRKKLDIGAFHVDVTAHKGSTLPAHFDRYEIVLHCHSQQHIDVAEQLIKDAKSICTISNCLSGTFTLSVKNKE